MMATTTAAMAASRMIRRVLRTAGLPAEDAFGADEQYGDQQDVRQEVGPGAEVGLHQHHRDAVDDAAEERAEPITQGADDDDGEGGDIDGHTHVGGQAAQDEGGKDTGEAGQRDADSEGDSGDKVDVDAGGQGLIPAD